VQSKGLGRYRENRDTSRTRGQADSQTRASIWRCDLCIVAICSTSACHGNEVASAVAGVLGYSLTGTDEIIEQAAALSSIPVERLTRALWGTRSVFNRLTREKERGVGVVRQAVAAMVQTDEMIIHSHAIHLLPRNLPQVLRVMLAAPMDYRLEQHITATGVDRAEAEAELTAEDEQLNRWTQYLFGVSPLTKSLYDIFLPMDSISVAEAAQAICASADAPAVRMSASAAGAAKDFLVAADVYLALATAGKGEDLVVDVHDGEVTISINRYAMWIERFEKEVGKIASTVAGVRTVTTKIGPHFHRPNIYPGLDTEVPRKILLVDDEVEFVQTLSERLSSRNLEAAVAHDGPEALAIADDDAPDVIVLDVKMPGMDGMEVLARLKEKHPKVQVIVLTAHGSEEGAKTARELGAFAYLRKPANVDELAGLMKDAYRAAREDAAKKEREAEIGESPPESGTGEGDPK
jgi:two-component system response regulator CpxR